MSAGFQEAFDVSAHSRLTDPAAGNLLHVVMDTAPRTVAFETVSSPESFSALAGEWDGLVRAMPRPSPALLHGWLSEWWRCWEDGGRLAVEVARRDGALVGALPLCVLPRAGLRVLTFVGGDQSPLADIMLAEGESREVSTALLERAEATPHDYADLFGLPSTGVLTAALNGNVQLIERSEAPVLDLEAGWEAVYQEKTSSKARSLHRRRRRQLAELGRLEVVVARTIDELEPALEDAFALHELRWAGRPDGSRFATPEGRIFHRAALRPLAELDVARIVTLKLDDRPIAFHYYFALERRMYVNRIAFDPEFGRHSPGLINTLDALQVAADEGATRVEFLGGAERYKLDFADRLEPLYEAIGLPGTLRGRVAVTARTRSILLRKSLKRSAALRRFYFDGLAPTRRLLARITG
jgi:CelD/BcsL family acetyltransferase involved in cellulose biosynthesis